MGITDTRFGEAYYAADDTYGGVGRKAHDEAAYQILALRRIVEPLEAIVRGEKVIEKLGSFQQILRAGLWDHEILDFERAELTRRFEWFAFHVLLVTQHVSLLDRETYLARPKLCQDRISRIEPDRPVLEDRHFPPRSQQPLLKRLRRLSLVQQTLRTLDYVG